MTDTSLIARLYLVPRPSSFWQWSEEAEAIVWADGKTIVFREELERIIRQLAPHGLPPLGALLLLLAACRDNWRQDSSELGILCGCLSNQVPESEHVLDAVDGLDRLVHALRPELRSSPDAKADLAEAFFEQWSDRLPAQDSASVLSILEAIPSEEIRRPLLPSNSFDALLCRDLDGVRHGLQRFDPVAFALRRRTGLDVLVEPAPVPDVTPREQTRALISQLTNDQELGGVARLAREIMAAVALPRTLSEQDDLPVGGLSDISNRGTLDRLLLTELAHDDLTLAVRVATNEALYFRRETPPRSPPQRRTLLLDSGLRMWGVPRVFATAVALAMSATQDGHVELDAFRASGRELVPLDLATREGLTEHLAALEQTAHPGDALAALETELSAGGDPAESVIIIGDDVWADREFQAALSATNLNCCYVATLNREGQMRLMVRTAHGSRLLREARLQLDQLLKSPARLEHLIDDREGVPAVCKRTPFPLFLSQDIHPSRLWNVQQGIFAVHRDGRLLHWFREKRGARQLATNLPEGHVHWHSHAIVDGVALAVIGTLAACDLWIVRITLATGHVEIIQLDVDVAGGPALGVAYHQGMLFVIKRDRVMMLELSSGRRVMERALQGMKVHRGRVLFDNAQDQWHLLSHDGLSIKVEPALLKQPPTANRLLTLLAPAGCEGCVGITRDFSLYHSATDKVEQITRAYGTPLTLAAVSRNERRVALKLEPFKAGYLVIDVVTGEAGVRQGSPEMIVELEQGSFGRPILRTRFSGLSSDAEGNLVILAARSGQALSLEPCGQKGFMLRQVPSQVSSLRKVQFGEPYYLSGSRIQLRRARWSDGSQALLDSRGLLHLRSSDSSLPELTVVLHVGRTTAWSSDGRAWGWSYFVDETRDDAREMFEEILSPFLQVAWSSAL